MQLAGLVHADTPRGGCHRVGLCVTGATRKKETGDDARYGQRALVGVERERRRRYTTRCHTGAPGTTRRLPPCRAHRRRRERQTRTRRQVRGRRGALAVLERGQTGRAVRQGGVLVQRAAPGRRKGTMRGSDGTTTVGVQRQRGRRPTTGRHTRGEAPGDSPFTMLGTHEEATTPVERNRRCRHTPGRPNPSASPTGGRHGSKEEKNNNTAPGWRPPPLSLRAPAAPAASSMPRIVSSLFS